MQRHIEDETRLVAEEISAAVNSVDPTTHHLRYPQILANPVFSLLVVPELIYDILQESPIALLNLIQSHPVLLTFWDKFPDLWKTMLYQVLRKLPYRAAGVPVIKYYALWVISVRSLLHSKPFLKRDWTLDVVQFQSTPETIRVTSATSAMQLRQMWPFPWVTFSGFPIAPDVQIIHYDAVTRAYVDLLYLLYTILNIWQDNYTRKYTKDEPYSVKYTRNLTTDLLKWWDPRHRGTTYFFDTYCIVWNYSQDKQPVVRGPLETLNQCIVRANELFSNLVVGPPFRDQSDCAGEMCSNLVEIQYTKHYPSSIYALFDYADRELITDAQNVIQRAKKSIASAAEFGELKPMPYITLDDSIAQTYDSLAFGPFGPYASTESRKRLLITELNAAVSVLGKEETIARLGTHHIPLLSRCGQCDTGEVTKTHGLLSIGFCGDKCLSKYREQHGLDFSHVYSTV